MPLCVGEILFSYLNSISQSVSSYSLDCVFWGMEIFNLMKCNVFKKTSPNPGSSRVSPMLPSRSFVVLCFVFRSMVHFELVVRSVSRFSLFFNVEVVVPAPFVEKTVLSPSSCLSLLSKISWFYLCASISELLILFPWSVCLSFWQ